MESCGICLESFTIENIVKPCKGSDKHIFCKSCIDDWIKTFIQNNDDEEPIVDYNILKNESINCVLCPVCRGEMIQPNNTEIYNMYGNLISVSDYVSNKSNSTYFKVKKFNDKNKSELKYEFMISPFSIKEQLHYSYPNDDNFSTNFVFSLDIFKSPYVILNGLFIEYYENGNIKVRKNMKNNVIHGLYESFYEDGTVKVITNYVENKFHGNYISYYLNGSLEINATFDNDNVVGNYEKYFDTGFLNIKAFFTIDLNKDNIYNRKNMYIGGNNNHSFLENVYIQYNSIKNNIFNIENSTNLIEDQYYLSDYEVYKNNILIKKYKYQYMINEISKSLTFYLSHYIILNKNNIYTYISYYMNKILKNYTYYVDTNSKEVFHGIYMDNNRHQMKIIRKYDHGKILEERTYNVNDNSIDINETNHLTSLKIFNYDKNVVDIKHYSNHIVTHTYYCTLTNYLKNDILNRIHIERKYDINKNILYKKYYYSNFNVTKHFKIVNNKSILHDIDIRDKDNKDIKIITYYENSKMIQKEEIKKEHKNMYIKNYDKNGNIKSIYYYDYINTDITLTTISNYCENGKFLNYTYEINNKSISKENKSIRLNQSKVNYLDCTYTLLNVSFPNKLLHDNVKVTFKNNKLNGKYYEYHNSKLYIVKRYKNNLLHGVSKVYDIGKFVNNTNNRYLTSYTTYKNGKKNGVSKTYTMNGKIINKSYYKDNLLHGLHQTFDYNTKTNSTSIIKEEYYENNILHGVCKYYNSSGVYILNYVHGKLDGKCDFIGNNEIIGIKYFKNHIPIGLHTIIDTSNNIKLIEINYDISDEEIGQFIDIDTIDYTKYVYGICERYPETFDMSNTIDLLSSVDLKVKYLILIDKSKINDKSYNLSKDMDKYIYIHGIVNIVNATTNLNIVELNYDFNKLCKSFDLYYLNGNKQISTYVENNKVIKYFDYYEENNNKLLSFDSEDDLIKLNEYNDLNYYSFLNDIQLSFIFKILSTSFGSYEIYYYSNYDYLTQEEYEEQYLQDNDYDDYDDYDNYSNDSYGYD